MNCKQSFIGVATAVDAEGLAGYVQPAPQPNSPGMDSDELPRTGGARRCGARQREAENDAHSA